MKGQANILTFISSVILVAVMLILGVTVYGYIGDVTPHDRSLTNESMCTTCTAHVLIDFDNTPVLNDTSMICTNASGTQAMRNGDDSLCGGFNVDTHTSLNLTNLSAACTYENVECDYTHNEANANEQSFFDDNASTTYAGFAVATVIVIVLAAVGILAVVLLIRG